MGGIFAPFIIAAVSTIVVRIGATALMRSGLSCDTASFQSYSAFFGVGFTTREAEMVVNHPLRRRIIRHSLEKAGVVHALDYELLLRVESGYCISEIDVIEDSVIAGKTLAESRPADLGIIILSIQQDCGTFTGAPRPTDAIKVGDVITAYGHENELRKISRSVTDNEDEDKD